MCHRAEEQQEKRAAAAFERASEAKTRIKSFKRLHLEPTAHTILPQECWEVVLSKLIDPKLWDLSFVRDICNAGALLVSQAAQCAEHMLTSCPLQAWCARPSPWRPSRPLHSWSSCWETPALGDAAGWRETSRAAAHGAGVAATCQLSS